MSNGLLLSANLSHSRLMEAVTYLTNGDPTLEKRVSISDRPNNFSLSGLYQLPFGRGKALLSGARGALQVIAGNWAVSSMYTWHSGAPVPWNNSAGYIYYGGSLNYDPRNVSRAFDVTRFNTVSSQQLSQNVRYFPSQFNNLRVDGTNNLNIAVTKDFSFREKAKLQFRADSFNVCNRPLFAAPSVSPTSGAFGTISSTTNTPRVIQGALRLTF